MIGTTVGKYLILDRLGRGGMGTVYKALDETLDREVAIKVLNPDLSDSEVLKRFRAEAVTLARLNHPGIATIYELYRHQDELLMVMEFVRGETVHDLSERLGPLPPPQAAHICLQVLDALAYAHRAGVVHRDLKPANLMVTDIGTVKVMDFGIARVLGTEHFTHDGYMMGTPAYMAPEQVLGREVDGRADLYAVGVLLYKLLTGELPFRADTAIAMAQKQIAEPPKPIAEARPDLPAWCATVVDRALAKAPEERFQRAEEFTATLASFVQTSAIGDLPTMATPTPPGLTRTPELQRLTAGAALTADAPVSGPVRTGQGTAVGGTTVVIAGRHLVAIGAVLVLLVAAAGALGFAAFRWSAGSDSFVAVPADPPAQIGQGASKPDIVLPVEPAPPEHGGIAEAAPAATAGSVAAVRTEATSARPVVATREREPDHQPAGAADAAAAGAPRRAVAENGGAPPAAAARDGVAVSFNDVRVVVDEGGRQREREGILRLGDGQVTLLDRNAGAAIVSVPYTALTGAYYSRSRQPKWRDASGQEIVSAVDMGRLGFLKADRNWLILTTQEHSLLVRFEDAGLRAILAAVQERTGQKIQR